MLWQTHKICAGECFNLLIRGQFPFPLNLPVRPLAHPCQLVFFSFVFFSRPSTSFPSDSSLHVLSRRRQYFLQSEQTQKPSLHLR